MAIKMKIPDPINSIENLIDGYHESLKELPRAHMGASGLGNKCERWIWLSFMWAVLPTFPGRMRRIFRRGHNEEKTVIADLVAIGVKIEMQQLNVDFGSHVAGSLDGVCSGVPQAPKAKHVLEIKTHNLKSFKSLVKKGVEASNPNHFAQVQIYMRGSGLERALYVAVCKDDDQIYTERIKHNPESSKKFIQRGHRLALTERMPEPLSTDSTWYECKLCSGYEFCHVSKCTKEVNCRTCANSTAELDSTFTCEIGPCSIPYEVQVVGCQRHVLHPDLVPWERKGSEEAWEAVYVINGADVRNGKPKKGVFSSVEILEKPVACANDKP